MASVGAARTKTSETGHRQALDALALARRLPRLVVAARDVAANVRHGVHGRRRAGTGETFWQFRPFIVGEPAGRIDWRRSARDDHTFVREREWEAAHTVWLWIDRSPSMHFVSALAREAKLDRATILGLAAADLLVRGGERVGLLGLTRPMATRSIIDRLAETLMVDAEGASAELPPAQPLLPRTQAILIGDFLSDAAEIERTLAAMALRGAAGHVMMIADPVEETFPFEGHLEFAHLDGADRLRIGDAQSMKDVYVARLATHRARIASACRARGWSFAVHRTDQPASAALLALRMRLEDGAPTPLRTRDA